MTFLSDLYDTANAFITGQLGEMGPLIVTGALGIVLIILALPGILNRKTDPLDKIKAQRFETNGPDPDQMLRRARKDERLDRFAQYLEPQNQAEFSAAQLQMVRAGYRSRGAVRTFHFAQFVLGIGGLLLGTLYVLIAGSGAPQATILSVLIPGCVGYYAPKYWIQRRVQSRESEIATGFPDALDLMLVCVEAGQSLDQGIVRVAKEIKAGYPALAEELEIVSAEIKAGKDKANVLRGFAERSGVSDVSSFVTVMIQSQTFGTSIADALRVYAGEMRDKRVMRAEEKANKLPTKMTLGTMMFTVPPLLIILVGPSVYDMMQLFAQAVN